MCVLAGTYCTVVLQEMQKIVRLEIWGFLCSFPCYQSCEQLIDLSHQALKACLITVTNHSGSHTVCLEKLLSSSENLDKEIGLFKPLKGVIKTPAWTGRCFWQFLEQAHKGALCHRVTAHNHEKSCHHPSFLCHKAAELQTSTTLGRKCSHQNFQGECLR